MAKHRRHHEGTIYERNNKNGDVIAYRVQITVPGGRPSETFKTKADARKWLLKAHADAAQGKLGARRPPTFAE